MTMTGVQSYRYGTSTCSWRRGALAVAVFCALSGAAQAEDAAGGPDAAEAASDSGDAIADVIVTATHRAERLQDVSSTVNAISGDALTTGEVRNAQDIILYLPNVSADTTDEHGRPKFYIRGIGLSDASIWNTNPIGIYQDDVYIWNSSTLGFPLFDLERVEVLSGPQGTLWGKNTTGGAIDFVSHKPDFTPDGYVKVSLGDYNDRLVEAAGGGGLNDIFAVRASVQTERSDDFAQNSTIPGTNSWSDSAIRLQLLGKFSDTFTALVNVHARDFEGPDSNGASNVLIPTPGQSPSNTPEFFNPSESQTQRGITLTLNKTFANDLTLTSITNREHFHELNYGPLAAVNYNDGYARTEFGVNQFSEELRLASAAKQKLSWILGAYYFTGNLESNIENGVLPGAVKSAGGAAAATGYNLDDYGLTDRSFALFGNADYKFTERFDLAVGLRGTTEHKDVDLRYQTAPSGVTFSNLSYWWNPANVQAPLTTAAQQDAGRTWSRATYDITPSYQVSDNVKVYFRNATGFNSGNFNGTAQTQATVAVIQPETVYSYELGAKTEWLDDRLIVNGAVFRYNYDHIQQKSTIVSPLNPLLQVITFVNAGAGYGEGVELEVSYKPIRDLTLTGNLGLNRTKFTDFQDTPTHNSAGNWFNRVPRNLSNLGANYKFPLPNDAHLVFDTIWAYQSKEYFNAVSQVGYPVLAQNGYWLGNISGGYASPNDKWEVRGYVRNALNTLYENTALITGQVGYGAPRTFGVTGIVHF